MHNQNPTRRDLQTVSNQKHTFSGKTCELLKFGPIVFLLLPIGNVIGGAIHDYFIGMMSMRNNGSDFSQLVKKFLGKYFGVIFTVVLIASLILLTTTFINIPGTLITQTSEYLFGINGIIILVISILAIFFYYVASSLFPIDKVIGRFYPYVGFLLFIVSILLLIMMIPYASYVPDIPLTLDGILASIDMHPDGQPLIPMLFVTVACGILSGFHATQSPIVARTMRTEKHGRYVFYGMMVLEGVIAMIWAAAFSILFGLNPSLLSITNAGDIVYETILLLFPFGLIFLAIFVFCLLGITSGDTAMRVSRTTLASLLHINQKKIKSRILVLLPILSILFCLLLWSNLDANGYAVIWNYFAWFNQIVASIALCVATVYLAARGSKWLITAVPGAFICFICVSYILWVSPGHIAGTVVGFGLPLIPSYIIAGILALIIMTLCVHHGKKLRVRKDFHPETEPVYPDVADTPKEELVRS